MPSGDSVANKYGYSGIYAGDTTTHTVIVGDENTPIIYDDTPEYKGILTNVIGKNTKGEAFDVVYGLKNFVPFNSCEQIDELSAYELDPIEMFAGIEVLAVSDITGEIYDYDPITFDLYANCAKADFYIEYYKAGTVDLTTGVGTPANITDAGITLYGLDNAGPNRNHDYTYNKEIGNYGEERITFTSGTVDTLDDYNDYDVISVDGNTISALTTDYNAEHFDGSYTASLLVDGLNSTITTTFSANSGVIGLMPINLFPYRPAAPVKSADKYEVEEGENIQFNIIQDFPYYVHNDAGVYRLMIFDNYYGDGVIPNDFKITNSKNEDVTAAATVWTLPSDAPYLPKDSFYFLCTTNSGGGAVNLITSSCNPTQVSARQFFEYAVWDDENFYNYLADKLDLTVDELEALITGLEYSYTLSDFFAGFGATETLATEEIPLSGDRLNISYNANMPSGISTLTSQVASVNEMDDSSIHTAIGNTILIKVKNKNPATGDLTIAMISGFGSISLLGAFAIIRKFTSRR